MSFENLLPKPEELYDHLLSELEYLRTIEGSEFSRNLDGVILVHEELKQANPQNWTLNIHPNWVFEIGGEKVDGDYSRDFSNNKGKAVIGGRISVSEGGFKEYSLNLAFLAQEDTEARGREQNKHLGAPCCWKHDDMQSDYRVARRYHFDIDLGDNDDESKPITHLQSGGKFKSDYLRFDDPHYCSSPLDKPRLPHPPMDPILIIHMLATQYKSLRDIIRSGWGSHVRDAENELWEPYHSTISNWYATDAESDTFASFIDNG